MESIHSSKSPCNCRRNIRQLLEIQFDDDDDFTKNTTIHLNLTHINCFQFKRKMFGSISITPTFHPFIHPSHSFSHLDIHSTIYPITSHPSIQSGSPQTKANGCQDLSEEKQQQNVSFKCEFKYFVRSFVGR